MIKTNEQFLSLSQKERDDLTPKIQKPSSNQLHLFYRKQAQFEPLQANVPNILTNSEFFSNYPINLYKQEILKMINLNRFLFIGGDSGIGKTTQIAQYILEFYQIIYQKCRIISSLPYNLQVYTTAKKVSEQRGELLGDTIGCHFYTNTKYSSDKTLLLFCTHEILLKNLMSPNEVTFLNSVTHLIIVSNEIYRQI